MTRTLLRGRILSFTGEPHGPDDTGAFVYESDGAVLIEAGRIVEAGDYATIAGGAGDVHEVDHRPHLIMPGFIDPHIHFPQTQVIASWGAQLLDWLSTYTFPEEARYSDPVLAAQMAGRFLDQLTAHGTTTAMAYCSVHATSAEALFAAAEARNMCLIAGKTMMDRNAPEAVCDTPQASYDQSAALIEAWHGRGRALYAVTPRFAITSTPGQLEAAGALIAAYPECYMQTHLSENHAEIALTHELYPEAPDYLGVYEGYGLLGPKAFLGHALHLEPREIGVLAETGSHPVFCPTSNLFLGSGLFDEAGLSARGILNAIATDVGGGTSYSMLATLAEGYKVLQLKGQNMHPYRAFHWITRGNAVALGLETRIGTLAPGSDADVVVLDARATPAMALRMERAETLAEELFVLQIMGDDRAVAETYVAGVAQKNASSTR